MQRSVEAIAGLVVQAERLGVIDGWRAYLVDLQRQSGINNAQMARQLEIERGKHAN